MRKIILLVCLSIMAVISYSQDLLITNVTSALSFDRYGALVASVTIKNQGIVAVNSHHYLRFYLSTDNMPSSDDALLASVGTPSLAPDASVTLGVTGYQITKNPGTYFVIAKADATTNIPETDEGNNTYTLENVVINPPDLDFQFQSFSLNKTTITVNDGLVTYFDVKNTGSTDFDGDVYTSFYLSTDATFSTDDKQFVSIPATIGDPDISANGNGCQLIIPRVQPGAYYVIGRVNDLSGTPNYTEADQTNNFVTAAITVEVSDVDLTVSSIIVHDGTTHNTIGFEFDITNHGTTPVVGYAIDLYLSIDAVLDAGDTKINYYPVDFSSLQYDYLPGNTTLKKVYGMGADLPAGAFYFIIKANPENTVAETNTDNNIAVGPTVNVPPPTMPGSIGITMIELQEEYDNTDNALELAVQLFNNSAKRIEGIPQNFNISIRNDLGEEVHRDYAFDFFIMEPYQGRRSFWTISLDAPLPPGTYSLQIDCFSFPDCITAPYNTSFEIVQAPYQLAGTVRKADNSPVTKGKMFLYQKNNATIQFIANADVDNTGTFNFITDEHPHTLYFIPDRYAYPNLVPTVLGKTVTLEETSFRTQMTDTEIDFEVIEIKALNNGDRTISGYITGEGSVGRTQGTLTLQDIPVMLLDASDDVVAITYTDAAGYFEFKNLPAETYTLAIAFVPEKPVEETPYSIDVTQNSVSVNFIVTEEGAQGITTPVAVKPEPQPEPNPIMGVEKEDLSFAVYPIPATNYIFINNISGVSRIEIIDMFGRTLKQLTLNIGLQQIDVRELNKGVYVLKGYKNKSTTVRRITKE